MRAKGGSSTVERAVLTREVGGSNPSLPSPRDSQLLELARLGVHLHEIARAVGLTPGAASLALKRLGEPHSPARKGAGGAKANPERDARIRMLHAQGLNITAIAETTHMSLTGAWMALRRLGLALGRERWAARDAAMQAPYHSGVPLAEIALQAGCSERTVRRVAQREGWVRGVGSCARDAQKGHLRFRL